MQSIKIIQSWVLQMKLVSNRNHLSILHLKSYMASLQVPIKKHFPFLKITSSFFKKKVSKVLNTYLAPFQTHFKNKFM